MRRPRFAAIVDRVWQERKRQDSEWGKLPRPENDSGRWMMIIQEELGESAEALLDLDFTKAEIELVEAAACIFAMIEDMQIKRALTK